MGRPHRAVCLARRRALLTARAVALAALALLWVAGSAYAQEAAGPQEQAPLDLSWYFPRWAQYQVLGIAVWQFIAAFVFVLLGLVGKRVCDCVAERRVLPLLEKTPWRYDRLLVEAARPPLGYLLLLGGLAGALAVLPLPTEPDVRGFVSAILRGLFAADLAWFLFRLVDVSLRYAEKLAEGTESKLDEQLMPLLRKALKVTIGIVFVVWTLQILGYSVSSLIAGLGIGGLAVALGLQDTLANFFGSVFIFLDRPFVVGDWVKVGDTEGVVEEVGFRTTRLRTWPATVVSIPNKTLASETIDNWSRMPKRRVVQTVGVTYETAPEQIERAVAEIRGLLESDDGVDKEFLVVRFTEFADSSLNLLLYYFTTAVDYAGHLETRERINLAIMRKLRDLGLSIAFPTQTVYLREEARDAAPV